MKISQLLDIKPGISAIIGAGGKTTLMNKLAHELKSCGTVIICTSTKIYMPEDFTVLINPSQQEIKDALIKHRAVCIGKLTNENKLTAPDIGFEQLSCLADYVIIEADGAHRLPLKAHESYEPVVPSGTQKTVLVVGADGFEKSVEKVCHRSLLYAKKACVSPNSAVSATVAAKVVNEEGLGDIIFINKVENKETMLICKEFAKKVDLPVFAGSLFLEEYVCLH